MYAYYRDLGLDRDRDLDRDLDDLDLDRDLDLDLDRDFALDVCLGLFLPAALVKMAASTRRFCSCTSSSFFHVPFVSRDVMSDSVASGSRPAAAFFGLAAELAFAAELALAFAFGTLMRFQM